MRHFRDPAGVEWRVFLTERSAAARSRDHYLPDEYRGGWLVFESATEKRRLAPVPADWATLADDALAALCAGASPQPPRGGHVVVERPSVERADAATGQHADTSTAAAARSEHAAPEAAEPLRPRLDAAVRQLGDSLEEVCDLPAPLPKLNTGELIRVEETLALAAEAAKEAVSLRRKIGADRDAAARRADERAAEDGGVQDF